VESWLWETVMFRSRRAKILSAVGVLALVMVISGFALTRGYLMRFNVNGERISRERFYAYADDALNSEEFKLGCGQGEPAFGWLYVYEINCFDTQAGVESYMATRYPR
jgi:hypothetical protein